MKPSLQARLAMAQARNVFPLPVGPVIVTFCCRRIQSQLDSEAISF